MIDKLSESMPNGMQQTAPAYMSQEEPTSTSVNLARADGLQCEVSDEA